MTRLINEILAGAGLVLAVLTVTAIVLGDFP